MEQRQKAESSTSEPNVPDEGHQSTTGAIAALAITPSVKHALITDTKLNDDNHIIDVDYRNSVVHLNGHVKSEDLRDRATAVAQRALDDLHVADRLENHLTVEISATSGRDLRQ